MASTAFDIFKEDTLGNALWMAAVCDPKTAQRRLNELASVVPREYFVADQRTSRVVESVGRRIPNLAYGKSANSKTGDASLHPDTQSLRAAPCLRSGIALPLGLKAQVINMDVCHSR